MELDVHDLLDISRLCLYFKNHSTAFANTIQLPVRAPAHSVRGAVRIYAEVTKMPLFKEVDHHDQVPGVGVLAMDAVTVDGNVCTCVIFRHEQFMDVLRKALKGLL